MIAHTHVRLHRIRTSFAIATINTMLCFMFSSFFCSMAFFFLFLLIYFDVFILHRFPLMKSTKLVRKISLKNAFIIQEKENKLYCHLYASIAGGIPKLFLKQDVQGTSWQLSIDKILWKNHSEFKSFKEICFLFFFRDFITKDWILSNFAL